jgi:putative transposase
MLRRPVQLEFPRHGGPRNGAGRPAGERVSHHPRPAFEKVLPVHVTLKVKADVPSLRSSKRFDVIRKSFIAARGKHGLRVVEFSVLGEHLHLIVEADNSQELSHGMQGLCVRLARRLNALLQRKGSLFADHYHSLLLRTPTELVRRISYILGNAEHHYGKVKTPWRRGPPVADYRTSNAPELLSLRETPTGWLLTAGWRRAHCPLPPGYSPPVDV